MPSRLGKRQKGSRKRRNRNKYLRPLRLSGVEIIMSHYTVGYHDSNRDHHEICEYAQDAYEAIQNSKEDVPGLREHPHFIDYCTMGIEL